MSRARKIVLIVSAVFVVILSVGILALRSSRAVLDVKVLGATGETNGNKRFQVEVRNGSDGNLMLSLWPKVLDSEHSTNVIVEYEKPVGTNAVVLMHEELPAFMDLASGERRHMEIIVAARIRPARVVFRGIRHPSTLERFLARTFASKLMSRDVRAEDVELEF